MKIIWHMNVSIIEFFKVGTGIDFFFLYEILKKMDLQIKTSYKCVLNVIAIKKF